MTSPLDACGSAGKESACTAGHLGSILGLRRSPGEGKGYPLQYSSLENFMDCSPCSHKESDTTEQLSLPHSSVGKESTYNAGDPGLIPGSGRSGGEGTGYPLQYSWASLVAQLVKNPFAMWETWV